MGEFSATEGSYVPMSSASLESGTATSVDHIIEFGGRTANDAQRACFLADQSDSLSASVVAWSND